MTERLSLSSVFSSEWPNTSYKPSSPFPCTLVLEGRGRGPEDWCSVSRDLPNPVFSPASHPGPPSTPQSPRSWCSQVHSPRVNLLSCLPEGAHLAAQGREGFWASSHFPSFEPIPCSDLPHTYLSAQCLQALSLWGCLTGWILVFFFALILAQTLQPLHRS